MNQKVFKIIDNMLKDKNEDVQDTLKLLLQDSEIIPFLVQNGPKVAEDLPKEKSKEKLKEEDTNAFTVIDKKD